MRVLLAGDDVAALQPIERALGELGHEVVGVAGGNSVLERTERLRPEIAVLDFDAEARELEPVVKRLGEMRRAALVVVVRPRDSAAMAAIVRRGIGAVVQRPVAMADLAVALEVATARFHDMQDMRIQTEEAQRERVRLLQVFAASADGIYIARHDGTLSMINDAAIRVLGLSVRDLRGRRTSDWPADFKPRLGAAGLPLPVDTLPLDRALRGEVVDDFELWIDALDGERRCLRLSAAPVRNGEGQIVEAVAVLRDVTGERVRAEEAARRTEQRRRELTQLSMELIGAASPEELARRSVARVREALGASRVRMITVGSDGKTRVLSGQVGQPLPTRGTTMSEGALGLLGYVFLRGETVRADDIWLDDRFKPDESEAEDRAVVAAPLAIGDRILGVLACASDEVAFFDEDDAQLVTLMANQAAMALENLRLADQVAAEQKMSALGVMAAGVVHEIKNPLAYVQANVESALELLERLVASGGEGPLDMQRVTEDRDALSDALTGTRRMFKIIDDIKTYAHPGQARREPTDVNRLVEVALTLAQSQLKRWCVVKRDFGRLPEVACDGAKVSQVVLNLLVNAAQAIERTGRMGNVEVSTRLLDGAVRIVVADDGPGMEPAVLRKIFVPFFTTKPAGVGTGLGLAISRRLMESQGGTIEVESDPDHGARFIVVLPIDAASPVVVP